MNLIKKTGKFLCSMKFAMILMIILVIACTVGSLIPQKEVMSYYTTGYSETVAGAILLFGLDDIFHCGWFIVLTLFLCLNLLLCNVLHFPKLIRQMKTGFSLKKRLAGKNRSSVCKVKDGKAFFLEMGFKKVQEEKCDGKKYLYASRNKAGIWGAWLCHLGMLIVIAGFGFGQMLKTEYTVYGVPGETKQIGDLHYELTIDNFEIRLREDDTVEQYLADITVTDTKTGEAKSGSTWVNSPISMYGMKIYQNSTGWAANVAVLKGEEEIHDQILCAGEYLETPGKEELILMLRAFYPDYVQDAAGNAMTASSALNNPAYIYALYYGEQMLGMNVLQDGEKITVDDYTFIFHDPQPYTLLQVKKDPFTWLAAIGGLMVLVSLILAFYVRAEEMWACKQEDESWEIFGYSRKGGSMFEEAIRDKAAEVKMEG